MVRVLAIAALGVFALSAQAQDIVTQTDLDAPDVSASERDDSPPAKAQRPAAKTPPAPAKAEDIPKAPKAAPAAEKKEVKKPVAKPARQQPKAKAVAAFWFILPGG
jgi:outer membrane biosynthesis protein TonB